MKLSDLPEDLLLAILGFLDIRDSTRLLQVFPYIHDITLPRLISQIRGGPDLQATSTPSGNQIPLAPTRQSPD